VVRGAGDREESAEILCFKASRCWLLEWEDNGNGFWQ
jgi:hypothetical protein